MNRIKEKELKINKKYWSKGILIEGVIQGQLSPYDVPRKVKATYDEKEKTFSLKFDYLTSREPTTIEHSSDKIKLHIGKISGKLYEVNIHCPSKEDRPDIIQVKVTSALDNLIEDSEKKDPSRLVQKENLSATRNYLKEESDIKDIIEELVVNN